MTHNERAQKLLDELISWRDEFQATTDADIATIEQAFREVAQEADVDRIRIANEQMRNCLLSIAERAIEEANEYDWAAGIKR